MNVKPTFARRRTVAATITIAATISIAVGCVLAWLVFSTHLSARIAYAGIVPEASLVAVYSAVALVRLQHKNDPSLKLVLGVLGGLFIALVVGAVLIQVIGCQYGACINL